MVYDCESARLKVLETSLIVLLILDIKTTVPEWAYYVMKHLTTRELHDKNRAARFTLVNKILYKQGVFGHFLRCICDIPIHTMLSRPKLSFYFVELKIKT